MMKTTKVKLAVIASLLTVAGVASLRSTTATNQPSASTNAAPGVDTSNEERVIGKYLDDLFSYQIECYQAKKRAVVRNADLDPLERKSDDLTRRLSEVQNAAREIIRKLKAANEFDDLDSALLARVNDPRRRAFFQETSFKADLEYAASNLSSHKDEISIPLDGLRKRVARNAPYADGAVAFVAAMYHAPTSMGSQSLGCRVGTIRVKLINRFGGALQLSPATCDAVSCACNPNSGGLCTGAPCSGAGATQ